MPNMEKDEYEIIVWFDKKSHKYQVIRIKNTWWHLCWIWKNFINY